MTQQDDITQRPLSGDETRAAVREARSMTAPSDTTEPGDYVMAGARALLSKLRAHVAPEPFRAAFANGVLPATRFHELWESAAPSKNSGHTMLEDLTWQVGKFAALVAAEVRAPVADERAQDVDLPWLRAYMHHQIASDRWVVTADQARDFARAAVLADRQARDALASAPVAGEAVYTLSVKGVFHNWKPTTVAFSIPDGEHQLFLRPAAPQVSECECSRKSKAVSDSEAQL
ncbi:hypothetical protein ACOTI2_08175 [Achromobacter xylosoxidans]